MKKIRIGLIIGYLFIVLKWYILIFIFFIVIVFCDIGFYLFLYISIFKLFGLIDIFIELLLFCI